MLLLSENIKCSGYKNEIVYCLYVTYFYYINSIGIIILQYI